MTESTQVTQFNELVLEHQQSKIVAYFMLKMKISTNLTHIYM